MHLINQTADGVETNAVYVNLQYVNVIITEATTTTTTTSSLATSTPNVDTTTLRTVRRVVLLKSRAKIRYNTIFLVESSKSASSAERGAHMYVFHFRLRRRWAREETAVSAAGKREDPDDSK